MDPRIQKMLISVRANAETKKLEEERERQILENFNTFLFENMRGISQIFKCNKATFVIINEYFANSHCLCFSPSDGFHLRNRKESTTSPDTERTMTEKIHDLHELFLFTKEEKVPYDMEGFQNDFVSALCNNEHYYWI